MIVRTSSYVDLELHTSVNHQKQYCFNDDAQCMLYVVTSIMNMIERRSTVKLQHPWVAAQPRFREARGHTRVWCSDEPRFLTHKQGQFIQSIIHTECPESPYTPTHSVLPFALFGANPLYQCLYGYFTAYDTVHYSDVIMGAMACSDRWIPHTLHRGQ